MARRGPVPSLYLPCTFPVPSLYLRQRWLGEARSLGRLGRRARAGRYGEASRLIDEFASAELHEFSDEPPPALPAELLPAAGDAAGAAVARAGRWARGALGGGGGGGGGGAGGGDDDGGGWAARLRPEGRLVVPREEWVPLDPATNPFLQFWLSLLPWRYAPPRAAAR